MRRRWRGRDVSVRRWRDVGVWGRWRRWRRWSRTLVIVTVQPDRHAARLVGDGHGVDVVPAVVTRGARPEGGIAVVLEGTVAGQAKTACGCGAFVTLPLSCRRREDAAAAVRVRHASGMNAVLALRHGEVGLANAILPVRELADAAARTAVGREVEAAGDKVSRV